MLWLWEENKADNAAMFQFWLRGAAQSQGHFSSSCCPAVRGWEGTEQGQLTLTGQRDISYLMVSSGTIRLGRLCSAELLGSLKACSFFKSKAGVQEGTKLDTHCIAPSLSLTEDITDRAALMTLMTMIPNHTMLTFQTFCQKPSSCPKTTLATFYGALRVARDL